VAPIFRDCSKSIGIRHDFVCRFDQGHAAERCWCADGDPIERSPPCQRVPHGSWSRIDSWSCLSFERETRRTEHSSEGVRPGHNRQDPLLPELDSEFSSVGRAAAIQKSILPCRGLQLSQVKRSQP
jgi:hypothetical protein